jgi:hypothetical protein
MQTRLARAVFVAIIAAGILASQQVSVAKTHRAAREQSRERQAKKACLSGDYLQGVSILADLFVETEDPVFLYNQGRCYEQNVRYVEAAERFREYLRKAGRLTVEDKAEVDKHIADCEAAAAKNRPRTVAGTPPAPEQPPVSAAPAPMSPPPPPIRPVATANNESPSATALPGPHPWQHTAKWVATGAAAAFLGLGVVEHVRYYSKNKDYNDNPACGVAGQCRDLADAADTAQIVAIVGYSAAAVAAGLAVTFWLTDSPRAQSAQPTGISLVCSPAWAGVACSGRF